MLTSEIITNLQKIVSSQNVLTKPEEREEYSKDSSDCFGKTNLPDVVIFVENTQQVIEIVKLAKKNKIPIICRGAGTNTVGACLTDNGGFVLSFAKMNKILEINPTNMTVQVQPGVIVGDLQKEVEKIGLFYPPDPSNLDISTIGGSIAQNSAGAKTFKYGSTKDYVIDMQVVTSDGEILRTGANTIKNSTGYNLNNIFIGSEGTLGIVVEATLKLIPKPQSTRVLMAYFDSVPDAINSVTRILTSKVFPSTIDFMAQNALKTVEQYKPSGLLTDKQAALIIELDGYESSMDEQENIVTNALHNSNVSVIKIAKTKEEIEQIWMARRSSMLACAEIKPNVTTDDVIVPRENLSKLVDGISKICDKYNLTLCMTGHVGDGSVHPQIPINFNDKDEYTRYKLAKEEIYDLTAQLDGIISGEHGIGREKQKYISKVLSTTTIEYMKKIKKTFDPENIFNPNKIFE